MRRFIKLVILMVILGANLVPEAGMFSQTRADRAVAFFEQLKHTKGKFYGKPFELLYWQKPIIRDVYGTLRPDGYRQYKYVYLEVPKKNGKSEIVAGSALYHTFADGERNGEVYGCAADKEQASLVFDVAVDMIDQLPALKKRARLNLSTKMITDKVSGTFYKVVSSEAYSKHGLNISACIFDELHAQPNRDLWDVMTFGAGDARAQPIWWIITTAGDDPDRVSICWEQHEYAAKILAGDIIDPTWYPVIYGYEGEDIYNEENWYKANPSLGYTITIESVREAAAKAQKKPADKRLFEWLRLNKWVTTKLTTWLPLELFDRTVGDWNAMDLVGLDCYLGMDLSSTTDLTAICLLFPPQGAQTDWRTIWYCWIPRENMKERIERDKVPYDQWEAAGYIKATDGDVVDYTAVRDKILELKKLYKIIEVDSDPAFATMLLQELQKADLTCVGIPQTYVELTDPMNQVEILLKGKASPASTMIIDVEAKDIKDPETVQTEEETKPALLKGQMTHEANPVARWCFGNTSIAKTGTGLIKYVKETKGKTQIRTKRIDLTAAWVCAMARARFYQGSTDLSSRFLSPDWGM